MTLILRSDGSEAAPSKGIVQADGAPFRSVKVLNQAEGTILARAFGLNKRNSKPTRAYYRAGRITPDSTLATLLNQMQKDGLVNLHVDAAGLSKKEFKALKAGDLSKGCTVAVVTKWGAECFIASVNEARDKMARAKAAEA